MDEQIILATNEKYWLKTKFKVWIKTPADSDSISGTRYRELAKEAIEEWKSVLDDFANSNQIHSRLGNIEFEIVDECDIADIRIAWNYSHQYNGFTRFEPPSGSIVFSRITIAKHHGPIIQNTGDPIPSNTTLEVRTQKEIKSVVKHEFGHALGLGHCSFSGDMMYNLDQKPNTERKISKLDLEVLSQKFSIIENPCQQISVSHIIPKDDWESLPNQ